MELYDDPIKYVEIFCNYFFIDIYCHIVTFLLEQHNVACLFCLHLTVQYSFSPLRQDISRINTHNQATSEINLDFGGYPLPGKKGLSDCLLRARTGGKYVRQDHGDYTFKGGNNHE
jgi:hypothetical protein